MKGERTCTVCNIKSTDNYCGNCGQSITKKKATFISLIAEFISNIIDVEKSVFGAMVLLIKDPKKIIHNYWNGYRKYYPGPGKFLIYALAIAALHLAYVSPKLLGIKLDIDQIDAQIGFWILFLPLLALTSVITFSRSKMGITKHIISLLYVGSCFFILITIVLDIILLGFGVSDLMIGIFFFLGLVFLWNARVFSISTKWSSIVLNTLLQLLVFPLVIAFITLLIYLIDPSTFKIIEN